MENEMMDFKDEGLRQVAEFHRAFNGPIADEPFIPLPGESALETLEDYAVAADRLAKQLRSDAAAAEAEGDEAGAMLLIRLQLIQEEVAELAQAVFLGNEAGALDALTDIDYVVNGTFLALGLGRYKVLAREEVHASNMSKLDENGAPIIEAGGRVVKGPNYRKPDLARVLKVGEKQ